MKIKGNRAYKEITTLDGNYSFQFTFREKEFGLNCPFFDLYMKASVNESTPLFISKDEKKRAPKFIRLIATIDCIRKKKYLKGL